jgi:putative ABC transport system permease protein
MFQDVRYAFRQLLKTPGFSIVAILTLALAIGANTAIFSAIDAVLLHPLSYPEPDRLVAVLDTMQHFNLRKMAPSAPEFEDYRKWSTSFSQMGASNQTQMSITGDGQAENLATLKVTANVFPMLSVKPVLGGLFAEENEQVGNDHVVLISRSLWIKRFAADRSIAGRKIQLNRESYQILGVIDPILDQRVSADLFTPLSFRPQEIDPGTSRPHNIDIVARLKPGVSIAQAREEFGRIAQRFLTQYPNNYNPGMQFSIDVDPLAERQAGNLRTPLLVLIAAVGALMLIACANISNLLLARAMLRRKEISIRAALGAQRSRLIRQLLTESLLLSVVGGTAGILLALYSLHLYVQFGPRNLILGTQPSINGWVMSFSLLISMAASILFGFAPALDTSRTNLAETLKEGARGSSGGRRLLRESMVAGEVAVSLILLIGTGLLIRSFVRLANTNPGFRTENLTTAVVGLPPNQYREPARSAAFIRSWLERVRALPGVRSAAATDFIQFGGGAGSSVAIVGHPPDPNTPTQVVFQSRVSPGYFQTMGIPLLRGRDITPSDELGTPPVVVIDETVVKKFFQNLDPIGMQINLPLPGANFTVIGVAGATKSRDLSGDPMPRAYYFGPQVPVQVVTIMIQGVNDPAGLTSAIRHEAAALDPNLPVVIKPMDTILSDSLARQRFSIQLMAVFAAMAVLLAAIGIYGVLAYLVDQRQRELGIRIALGARAGDVLGLVFRQGSVAVVAGLIVGVAGAFGLTRLLKSLLFEVSATDPLIFVGVSAGLVLVALVAMWVPAWRATRVDPLSALHHD